MSGDFVSRGRYRSGGCRTSRDSQRVVPDGSGRSDEARVRFRHDNWNVEQMIEMPVSNEGCVWVGRKMLHRLVDANQVRFNLQTKSNAPKIDPRKIRINEQRVALGFKLESIRSEISHAHVAARRITAAGRVARGPVASR